MKRLPLACEFQTLNTYLSRLSETNAFLAKDRLDYLSPSVHAILHGRKTYRVSYHLPQTNLSEFHGHRLPLPGTERLTNVANSNADFTAGRFLDKAVLTASTRFSDDQSM